MIERKVAIDVSHLKKSYKKVSVLKDVSFSVKQGSIFALLGANGAGKTTAINILATLLTADSGEASVDGFDVVRQAKDARSHISLTGQFAAVDDILTARENLELIGDLRHVESSKQTATELLKKFDLEDAADRRVLTFSGGMRRRLDIAMSLIGDPPIIFFDEPTTGLDPQSRNGMWETIKSLSAGGTTIFLTTQYLEEADQLADTIAILHNGKIEVKGTPEELKKLLPSGQIELKFYSEEALGAAKKVLTAYKSKADASTLALMIETNGSVSQLTSMLTTLERASIEVAEFAQKAPSLDDVFLKVINENKEGA